MDLSLDSVHPVSSGTPVLFSLRESVEPELDWKWIPDGSSSDRERPTAECISSIVRYTQMAMVCWTQSLTTSNIRDSDTAVCQVLRTLLWRHRWTVSISSICLLPSELWTNSMSLFKAPVQHLFSSSEVFYVLYTTQTNVVVFFWPMPSVLLIQFYVPITGWVLHLINKPQR